MTDLADKKCKNCEKDAIALNQNEIKSCLNSVNAEWELAENGKSVKRTFKFPVYSRTIAFVNAVAWIATEEAHHPEMIIGYNYCEVNYSTHSINALTENDFICAAKIDLLVN